MTNTSPPFLVKLGVLVLLLVVIDAAIGTMLRSFYFRQTSGLQYRTTYSLRQTKADVLFFGSSRCNHHYNPAVFEDSLGLTCYNVGRDGNRLPYHYAMLKGILGRYTPKVIVLDVSLDDFEENDEAYDRLSSLLPYYRDQPEIQPIIEMRSPFERIKLLSRSYPYNSSLLTIAVGNMAFNQQRKQDIKGYLPLFTTWKGPSPAQNLPNSSALDNRKVKLYEAFLAECRQRDIKLYVTVSPYFVSFTNTTTLTLARQIADRQNVPFLNFSQEAAFLRAPHYFSDPGHLNNSGANLFSTKVARQLTKDKALIRPGCPPDPARIAAR